MDVSRNFRDAFEVDAGDVSRAKRGWRRIGQRRASGQTVKFRRAKRRSLKKLIQIIGAALLSASAQAGSLTLITHGMDADARGWVLDMAKGIRDYQDAIGEESDVVFVKLTAPKTAVELPHFVLTQQTFTSTNADRNVVVALDWSDYAGSTFLWLDTDFDTAAVAPWIAEFLIQNGVLRSRSLHLIGHSRGGSLLAGAGDLLEQRDYVIEQFTTLDARAHPMAMDVPPHVPGNVLFADNYFETYAAWTHGDSLLGAYNRQPPLEDYYGWDPLGNVTDGHTQIHQWYQRTIDQSFRVPGDAGLLAKWFTVAEAGGSKTGYYFAHCEHGERSPEGFLSRRIGQPKMKLSYDAATKQLTTSSPGNTSGRYYWQQSSDLKHWFSMTNYLDFDGLPYEVTAPADLAATPNTFLRLQSF